MNKSHSEICIKVSIKNISDGTKGISLSGPDKLIGEWVDSGAYSLSITPDCQVSIYDESGKQRYLLTFPGTPIRGEQLSETEAAVILTV